MGRCEYAIPGVKECDSGKCDGDIVTCPVTVPPKKKLKIFTLGPTWEDFQRIYVEWLPILREAVKATEKQDWSKLVLPECVSHLPKCLGCGAQMKIVQGRIFCDPNKFGYELDLLAECPNRFKDPILGFHFRHSSAYICLSGLEREYVEILRKEVAGGQSLRQIPESGME